MALQIIHHHTINKIGFVLYNFEQTAEFRPLSVEAAAYGHRRVLQF